jgi:hypothetical protein
VYVPHPDWEEFADVKTTEGWLTTHEFQESAAYYMNVEKCM